MPTDPTSRTLIVLAGLAVLAGCVWLLREILPPFVLAMALALLLDPLRARLQGWGLPRGLAVGMIFAVFLALFVAVIALLVPRAVGQVGDLIRNLDSYGGRLQELVDGWAREHAALLRSLNLPPSLQEIWSRYQTDISGYLTGLLQQLFAALQVSAAYLGWVLVVPIVTLYLMLDLDALKARLRHLIAERHRETASRLSNEVVGVFAAYLRGLTLISLAYGMTAYLALVLFQVPYALILGLVACLLYAVPYLGQLALIVASATIVWATSGDTGRAVGVVVGLLVVGQLYDQLITPRVIGKQVGLHPVLGLFALMAGGHLFGLPGMVVAVPVAASLRIVLIRLFPRLGEPLPAARPVRKLARRRVPEEP